MPACIQIGAPAPTLEFNAQVDNKKVEDRKRTFLGRSWTVIKDTVKNTCDIFSDKKGIDKTLKLAIAFFGIHKTSAGNSALEIITGQASIVRTGLKFFDFTGSTSWFASDKRKFSENVLETIKMTFILISDTMSSIYFVSKIGLIKLGAAGKAIGKVAKYLGLGILTLDIANAVKNLHDMYAKKINGSANKSKFRKNIATIVINTIDIAAIVASFFVASSIPALIILGCVSASMGFAEYMCEKDDDKKNKKAEDEKYKTANQQVVAVAG